MGVYLNTNKALENYLELNKFKYSIDKSMIIENLNELIGSIGKYVCITRPRRFGKTSVINMLGAYYTKNIDSKEIFDKLKISNSYTYEKHLNKHNVINISFNKIPDNECNYSSYMEMIKKSIINDIVEVYPSIDPKKYFTISDLLSATNDKFIFIFDEWDYIFNNKLFEENQNEFLDFLRNLLKDKPYVLLTYMTGVLPIKKHSSTSALNMFDEYTMLNDMIYGDYFGFTEAEVKYLVDKQNKLSFEEISNWYNGYMNEEGYRIYNPRSVVKALQNGKCISYWTNTGGMDEVTEYLKYNTLEVREDVIEMIAGEEVDIFIDEEFRAGQKAPKTKEEIYSAMIILGFLAYHDGYLKIPNKELMREFEKALKDESFGYVSEIIKNSKKILKATLREDSEIVQKILHDVHNAEIPILQYNDENSLSCVVTLAYLGARDSYRIEREEKTGKGFADFTFHPRRQNDIPIILELKKNEKVEVAIKQMKEKEYFQKFISENKEVLIVAICYSTKEKNHKCKIEKLDL
ncbi:MAG: AAA family ATPase [Sarcina sp.]